MRISPELEKIPPNGEKPSDPDPEVGIIWKVVIIIIGDLDEQIELEVEEQLKELKETLDERERHIYQLEKDLKALAKKQPSFTRVF